MVTKRAEAGHPLPSRRVVRLVRRPRYAVRSTDFEIADETLPPLADGEALVETLFVSIDPTHRLWLSARPQYSAPIDVGEIVRGFGVGRITASRSQLLPSGLLVAGLLGWTSHRIVGREEAGAFVPLPPLADDALPALVHLFGPSGVAAYYGLFDVAGLQRGETVIVTSAAGAVGSIAGQLAKRAGCRTVGIAGGAAKCAWLEQAGFDAAIDRHRSDWRERLEQATPGGADVLFENVGGEIMAGALARLKHGGRVALCGMVAGYNDEGPMTGDWTPVLMRSLQVRGFQISGLPVDAWARAQARLRQLDGAEALHHRETMVEGLDQAPAALHALLSGSHHGKLLVRVTGVADGTVAHGAGRTGHRPAPTPVSDTARTHVPSVAGV